MVRICPLLPQPRSKSSQLLLLRVPQILGTAQAGDQGRASTCSLPGGGVALLAPQGSRAFKLSYTWPTETGPPALGRELEARSRTTLLKYLDPRPRYTITFRAFSSEREGPFGGLSGRPSSPSFLPPSPGQKGKGPKALWAIISQQLLVSKISVGSRFRTL